MAQGDSIGRVFSNEEYGKGSFDVSPPVGEVWLITYINLEKGNVGDTPWMYIGGLVITSNSSLVKNEKIKLFVSSNTPMIIAFSENYSINYEQLIFINGVQFK